MLTTECLQRARRKSRAGNCCGQSSTQGENGDHNNNKQGHRYRENKTQPEDSDLKHRLRRKP
eukprot:812609-Heterocapsa_arctica.AAC.1